MKPCRILLLAVLMFLVPALAQQSPVETPASREQILRLFEVMHIRQQMRSVMEGVLKQQSSLVRDTMRQKYPHMTEDDISRMNEYILESMKDLPVDGILDDMIPVYQRHLSQTDVDAMTTFYSSPTGQKLMQEMPAMTSEGMKAAYPRMQGQMEKVMQRVEEKMKPQAQPRKDSAPKTPTHKGQDHSTT